MTPSQKLQYDQQVNRQQAQSMQQQISQHHASTAQPMTTRPAPSTSATYFPSSGPAPIGRMRQRSAATTSAPAPVPAAASAPDGFPDGLTEWVKRHFEIAVTDADKADVENRIRVYISELGSQLWSKNWETETMILPPHLLQLQRRHEQSRNHSSFSSSSSSTTTTASNYDTDQNGRIDNPWRKKRDLSESSSHSDTSSLRKKPRWEEDYERGKKQEQQQDDDERRNTKSKRQNRKEAKEAKRQKKLEKQRQKKNRSKRSASSTNEWSEQDHAKRRDRAKRFERSVSAARGGGGTETTSLDRTMQTLELLRHVASRGGHVNWDDVIVKGTCTLLLKDYYRLNEVPDPTTVRPEAILRQAVESMKEKHRADAPSKKLYSFLNNQYKAIRQDLTVQHIKNDFVVDVYETHAR
jgi:hypothetical protein